MTEQPYLLTVHVDGEEETYRFSTLVARDAFIESLKEQGDTGPLIPDDKFEDYQARRETTLSGGGVCIDVFDSTMKFSMSEEAYRKIVADAQAAGLDPQTYLQQNLDRFVAAEMDSGLTRQQRRQRERQAAKKARKNKGNA